MSARLKYGSIKKKILFRISLFLACETSAQEKTFAYLYFPRELNAFVVLFCVVVLVLLLTASAQVCAKNTGGLDL